MAVTALAVATIERVVDVTARSPEKSQHDRWTLDLLVDRVDERLGVPPSAHEAFGEYELTSVKSGPQGPNFQWIITVG
jgi:hypothetical protein